MAGTRVRKRSPVDSSDATAAVKRYAAVVDELIKIANVNKGAPGKKGFGSGSLQIDGKIFAMLSSQQHFVVKLPRDRVDALVVARRGSRFDPGHGRLMKEWFGAGPTVDVDWVALATEALSF